MENTNPNLLELPALKYDYSLIPHTELRLDLPQSEAECLKVSEQYQNMIAIVFTKEASSEDFSKQYYPIGVLAKIKANMAMPGNMRRVKMMLIERLQLVEQVDVNPCLIIKGLINVETRGKEEEIIPIINLIREEVKGDIKKIPFDNKEATVKAVNEADPNVLPDILGNLIMVAPNRKMLYLQTLEVSERLKLILQDIHLQKMYIDLESKIDDEVRKNINESQKEYYLREKIRAIQDELGDKVKKDSDVEELRNKILACKMPKNVEEDALKELARYQSSNMNSPETGVIRTYLDFIISLPWSIESVDCNDINSAKEELDRDHYGLDKVKDRILEYLAVKILNQKNPQSILCLVGPPGVGKTSLARSIAKALNKNFVKESLGGVRDEAEIRGHRRTYVGALPGRILQGLQRAKTNNPVFLLDEVDKLSSDFKGDPTSALLEVLDPEQNCYFSDHYLDETFDLSKVFFICTANYLGNIPAPLRDRLEIVQVSSYTEFEKFEIAKRHLVKKQMALHGVDEHQVKFDDDAILEIIRSYTREAGVRELERYIGSIIRKAIKQILMDKMTSLTITKDNLATFVGKAKYMNSQIENNDLVGVVNGLAYTEYGGDTLEIEVAYYPGNGHLIVTGSLGDVMKESAQAALSYVKANAVKYHIDANIFKENDIHIHVPEGAVPKDGPSAGVTLATALVSALSNKPVHHDVGMTGEITLRGRVLPIGGLREKSIAANRSGLKTILIPNENVRDLDEVPDTVKQQLKIIPVSSIDEVIDIAIIK